jgi:hypothetical protein
METSGKKSSSKKKSMTRKKSNDSKERKASDAGLEIKNRARVYPHHVENAATFEHPASLTTSTKEFDPATIKAFI